MGSALLCCILRTRCSCVRAMFGASHKNKSDCFDYQRPIMQNCKLFFTMPRCAPKKFLYTDIAKLINSSFEPGLNSPSCIWIVKRSPCMLIFQSKSGKNNGGLVKLSVERWRPHVIMHFQRKAGILLVRGSLCVFLQTLRLIEYCIKWLWGLSPTL
jgi:hypothetical protein